MMTIEKFYDEHSKGDVIWFETYRESWMSDDQWLLTLFLYRFFKGFHHIPTKIKPASRAIEINFRPSFFATFDYDYLTKLVVMAHNWGVRADISGSGPAMIKLKLWKRHKRDGSVSERHPTIEQAISQYKDF